ncbi:protein of unknown function Met10 [Ferroglobus placidus DSM 10642]|uniref:tRNA (guanine(37)-N(1))-methyltransferase n=1 Tax=Ferroglobus placidus (strain DSM 10642 / AEDII12DO) TaxID=589924 RepID=D3S121_FERPA|nr:class I SAM-dependent methyltransferase family protein [Ferroglobus placidus]ADC64257.1 protein of unknown function Met10 [Ferroglobus placidus DSM 10642]
MSLKEMLKDKVTPEELSKLRRSFEIIGDVVIIEIPDEILHLKDEIAKAILAKHKHVKTILRKVGEVEGDFRIAKYEVIYGGETETIAKEHSCRFLVDPTKAYYTVKLSGERERIAKLVREGERVLVMYAGVGPYAIVIARLSKPREVIGIELNPVAVEYFKKNVKLNKVEGIVKVIEGDVRDVVPKLEGVFDRVVMPAPYHAEDHIYLLEGKLKEGSYVHIYTFAGEEEVEEVKKEVREEFEKIGAEVEIERIKKCGSYAPRVYRFVVDVKVSNLKK